MSDNQVSDILAQAFVAEGVDTLFTLMGDANMYWSASNYAIQRALAIAISARPTCHNAAPDRLFKSRTLYPGAGATALLHRAR
jgi:hypothetical protein